MTRHRYRHVSPCHDVLSSEHENDIENEIEIENENATILVLTILKWT